MALASTGPISIARELRLLCAVRDQSVAFVFILVVTTPKRALYRIPRVLH